MAGSLRLAARRLPLRPIWKLCSGLVPWWPMRLKRYKRVDVLINNVGGTIWAKPSSTTRADRGRGSALPVPDPRSAAPCCRASCSRKEGRDRQRLVDCHARGVNRVPYAAAKGGVNALTASLAMEHTQTASASTPLPLVAPRRQSPQDSAQCRQANPAGKSSGYQATCTRPKPPA